MLINAQLLAEAGTRRERPSACTSPDRLAPRLPAAHRPHHAHPPAEGSGHRRRLRAEGGNAQRAAVSLHALLDADFYREGARVTPAPRRRSQRRARRKPGPMARPGDARRRPAARGHPARVAAHRPEVPRRGRAAVLGHDRRTADPLRPARRVRAQVRRRSREQGALEQFLSTCAAENPNRRLRMTALMDRVATPVERLTSTTSSPL